MADLTTKALVKQHANITVADDDTIIDQIVAEVSAAIEKYCGRVISESAGIVENHFHSGATAHLVLNEWPVTTLTTIVEVGTTLVAADYLQMTEDTRRITRLSSSTALRSWSPGLIVVTYTAGYSTIPKDIEGWATIQALHRFNEAAVRSGRPGVTSKDNETGSVSFESGALLPAVREGLRPWKRPS